MSTQKKTLSPEEIEAQTALELPDREVMQAILIGNIVINAALAINVCPAVAVGVAAAQSNCVAAAVAQQKIG
jgi:hypothetical protein